MLEINTRKVASHAERLDDLTEALAFTRLHLAAPRRLGYADAVVAPATITKPKSEGQTE